MVDFTRTCIANHSFFKYQLLIFFING